MQTTYEQLPLTRKLDGTPKNGFREEALQAGSAKFSEGRSAHRERLYARYAECLQINPIINRSLISFQANKTTPFYRWFKYKEAFSAEFVEFILAEFQPPDQLEPTVLDPFAGAGTTLTTAVKQGWQATGIELMPVGPAALRARLLAARVDLAEFRRHLTLLEKLDFSTAPKSGYTFTHIRITEDAFPVETEAAFGVYDAFLETIPEPDVQALFHFAWLAILEDISYTRKDGQYLRWDHRSRRIRPSKFNKGPIHHFKSAIVSKLYSMMEDISLGAHTFANVDQELVTLHEGSSLSILPTLPASSVDLVLTSPPYCNRYDYTRTYALELAFAGKSERQVKQLRQTLLSATVENKTKREQLAVEYRKRGTESSFAQICRVFDEQEALHEILALLYTAKAEGSLNNSNIPAMIENYFFEMNVIIAELARILKPGGHVVMVNDNVQYHGEEVPVDLVLSDFAVQAGLVVDKIWVLPRGKGNSSQQMGAHGRNEIRKCVYVWSKPQTYNTFISSIIINSTGWTLENGRRTIIATLGITLDGTMRNKIGSLAEERIRTMLLNWLVERDLIVSPALSGQEPFDELPSHFTLTNEIEMTFQSEPDVAFHREGDLLAVIEIKGGIDSAGGLFHKSGMDLGPPFGGSFFWGEAGSEWGKAGSGVGVGRRSGANWLDGPG